MTKTQKKLEANLSQLEAKGYIVVGYEVKYELSIDVLLIHKDWKRRGWHVSKHFKQAFQDLWDVGVAREYLVTIESPPLEAYLKERTGGPDHKLVVNRIEVSCE